VDVLARTGDLPLQAANVCLRERGGFRRREHRLALEGPPRVLDDVGCCHGREDEHCGDG
jgi:hypothetical protein